jgi:hypothetical protein
VQGPWDDNTYYDEGEDEAAYDALLYYDDEFDNFDSGYGE